MRALVAPCLSMLVATACNEPVDPGDVRAAPLGTSSATDGWAVSYPKQRKVLSMNGRLWLFYADGTDTLVRSTVDGSELSEPALVREQMHFGHRCSFAFDGRFVHYACCAANDGEDVFYRRGSPADDGTITWEEEQLAFEVPVGQNAMYPKVVVESGGVPWVAFVLFEGGYLTAPQDAVVIRAASSDGRFAADAGFPFVLVDDSLETYPDPLGVPLLRGGVYWLYDLDGEQRYRGRPWRDDAWLAEEIVTEGAARHALFDAVADDDEVHLAYGAGVVRHRKRDDDGAWGEERVLALGGSHMSITRTASGHVSVAWLDRDGQRVVARDVAPDELGPTVLLFDASERGGLAGADLGINLNGLAYASDGFRTAVTLTTGGGAPYDVWLVTRPR